MTEVVIGVFLFWSAELLASAHAEGAAALKAAWEKGEWKNLSSRAKQHKQRGAIDRFSPFKFHTFTVHYMII